MKDTIIWTALPNGRSATGKLMMSAHVTFHLSYTAQELASVGGKAKISHFPIVSGFKPESVSIKVLFNGKPVEATIVSKPEVGLWSKFFPADGPVTSYEPVKPVWQEVRTFATFDIYKHLESVHADHIVASFEPSLNFKEQAINTNISQLMPSPELMQLRSKRTQGVRSSTKDPHAQQRAIMDADMSHTAMKSIMESRRLGQTVTNQRVSDLMVEAVHFHRPFLPSNGDWALPTRPESDFHDALAMVCQHPQLMRLVGVVFDLEISNLPAGDGVLSLQVEGLPSGTARFPGTMCTVTSSGFIAKERTSVKGVAAYSSDIVQGFMRMNPEDVALGAMDLSGAVLQTSGFLDHVASKNAVAFTTITTPIRIGGLGLSQPNGRPAPISNNDSGPQKIAAQSSEADDAGLPPRRTAGITLYRKEHSARHLIRDTMGENIYSARFADTLYADDIHKGWRPDVLHKGKWFSLTARSVFYRIADKPLPTDLNDEGHVSPSNTASPDGKVVKIPESVLTWDGWSLAAPKPVSPLVDRSIQDDTVPNTSTISSIAEARSHNYQPNETDKHYKLNYFAEPAKGSLPTLRFGEVYAIRSRSVDLAGNSLPLGAKEPSGASQSITYLRHEPILPPSVHMHDSAGPGESAYVVAVRKSSDGKVGSKALRFLYPPVGGFNMAELHGKFDLASGAPDPAFWDKVSAVDARKELAEVISSVNAPPVPYLVDPACVGAAVKRIGRASKATDIATTSFLPGNAWIDAQASTLSLMPGSTFQMTGSTGVQGIGLTLAPGQDITVALSSTTSEDYLPVFEQTRWIEKSLQTKGDSLTRAAKTPKFSQRMETHRAHQPFKFEPVAHRPVMIRYSPEAAPESSSQKALEACLKGQNSALTPTRSVRMVYATQVPEPGFKFDRIDVIRDGTSANFDMEGKVHGWSTEELEVTIVYADPVDDLSEHRRKTTKVEKVGKVSDLHPPYIDTVPINVWFAKEDIEFHDTKAHIVEVMAVVKTRYADFFPNVPHVTQVDNRVRARQIKATNVNQLQVTDGVVGDYTKTYINSNVVVKSTKKPDKPQVEYILPTVLLASESSPTRKVSRKRGNTVRIYLRRPWFSSGIGEQLAVIINDGSSSHMSDSDYVNHTVVGADPAFEVPNTFKYLQANHFVGQSGVVSNVPMPDIGFAEGSTTKPATATFVTYDPHFDDALQLWYVDVEINMPTRYYTPFLRFALCRYQVNATDGNQVSAIAVTEVTQPQPDRVAVVNIDTIAKRCQVYYVGVAGRTSISQNIVVGTVETKISDNPEAAWLPVMHGNDPLEFFVALNGEMATLAPIAKPYENVENLFEWAAQPENVNQIVATTSPGAVSLPAIGPDYRIVLREYEVHPSLGGDPPIGVNAPGIAGRLVHADIIYLAGGPPVIGGRPGKP
jgi:hypothetical protein